MKLGFVFLCCILYANAEIQNIPIPNLKKTANYTLYKNIALQFSKASSKAKPKQQGIIANKIANNVLQDSKHVCTMLFYSAIKDLQRQALNIGASKVGNITSHLDNNPKPLSKYFPCKIGIFFNTVTLRADIY